MVKNDISKYKHLYHKSLLWHLCSFYINFCHKIFYKKIYTEGFENIPKSGSIIFAPNHQNALMDPLSVLFTCFRQIVFLARADIFKNKIFVEVFYFLKILPVFRIRDGKECLKNNDKIFDIAVKILESNQNLGLFPETTHNEIRQILQHKKAIPKLSFWTMEKNNFELNLKIIPVGIFYDNYYKWRPTVFVNYGNPISVKNFKENYLENPQKAINFLRDEIYRQTIPLIINIENKEYYNIFDTLRIIYSSKIQDFKNKFSAEQQIIEKLNILVENNSEGFLTLKSKVEKYEEQKIFYKIKEDDFVKYSNFGLWLKAIITAILTIPFSVVFLNNIIPIFLQTILVSKIKDKQFTNSIRFVFVAIIFLIFYFLQTLIFLIISKNLVYSICYFALSFITGYLLLISYNNLKTIKLLILRTFGKKHFFYLNDLRNEIYNDLQKV